MLLEEHERRDRVRAKSDETRHPALEDPAQTFLCGDASDKADDAFLSMRAHHAGLDHVDGTADRRCDKSSHDRGSEVGGQVVAEVGALQELLFEDVVAGQLRRGHEDCADAVGPDAAEEAAHAFVFDHASQTVNGVLVVASLLNRQRGVVLHPYVEDVGGVTCDAAQEARSGGHSNESR